MAGKKDNDQTLYDDRLDANNNKYVTHGTLLAGERRQDSTTESYLNVRQGCRGTIISATTAVTIGGGVAGDTHLMGVLFTVALTGTCVITGFVDGTGAAKSLTFPAATTAGHWDFKGLLNEGGPLTVTCSNASDDDDVIILWSPA